MSDEPLNNPNDTPDTAFAEADLIDLLDATMQAQETELPRLKYLHRHLSGIDRDIHALITQLMTTPDPQVEGTLLDALEACERNGQTIIPALLHVLLTFKHNRPDQAPSGEGA